MEARTLRYVVSACGGLLKGGSLQTRVQGVCTDSRRVQAGDLFFALAGERFDGHQFLVEAAAKGVAAIVAARDKVPADFSGCAVITVEDTRKALGRLAAAYRNEVTLPITTVGGSNGKTTTKELAASMLRQKLPTLWSEASFNNDIGVPLTLLRLEGSHHAAVMEVGTNHPGEMAPLLQMIQPQFGILTSIGREHLEGLGSLANVAQENAALLDHLCPGGLAVVNADSPLLRKHLVSAKSIIKFGESSDADIRLTDRGETAPADKSGSWWFEINGVARFVVHLFHFLHATAQQSHVGGERSLDEQLVRDYIYQLERGELLRFDFRK